MDHSDIERDNIVDRYLLGKLPAHEATRFEEHFLHCRDCLDQLKLAQRLQRGIKRAAGQDAARAVATRQLGALAWISRLGPARRTGLAAALLAVALLPAGLLYRQLARSGRQLERARASVGELQARALEPRINLPIYPFSPERGSLIGGDPSYVIRLAGDPWIVLSLELDRPQHSAYRVTLLRDGRQEIWRAGGLVPNHLDAVVLALPSARLEPGIYVLRVEATGAGAEPVPVASFSFEAKR